MIMIMMFVDRIALGVTVDNDEDTMSRVCVISCLQCFHRRRRHGSVVTIAMIIIIL